MANPLDRVVIQIDMSDLEIFRQGVAIDREPVVLAGNLDPGVGKILDRLIRPSVTELELESLGSRRQT